MWFAGLRGAMAFALSMNLPGPNSDTFAGVTLFICLFTTVVCGSLTEKILTHFGMRHGINNVDRDAYHYDYSLGIEDIVTVDLPLARQVSESIHSRYTDFWRNLDENYMQELFGGAARIHGSSNINRHAVQYELSEQDGDEDDF
jgi:sodium/hydrogen exchanger 8